MALAYFKSKANESYLDKKNEDLIDNVKFTVHKFNHRIKPKKLDRIKIISCFSEFGCETLGCMYCIPRLMKRFPGSYIIAMGWHGREYLYRHLVDEFWEIDESYMWLREYTRAFHHVSTNLENLEKAATKYGEVIPASALGKYAVCNFCRTCGKFWHEWRRRSDTCSSCGSTVIIRSMFTDTKSYKKTAVKIPQPSQENIEWAKGLLKQRPVGIFARGRKTYGRNLQPDFYVKLINQLRDRGHSVVWLGEKQSTLPCPVDDVFDFTKMPESRDLEKTLSIISQLEFTVQFWTASTRLAGMMGTPFLLFESPEQIYVSYSGLMSAQEGKRLELTAFGNKKVVIAHYHNVFNDNARALELVDQAIDEMEDNNWSDIIGMVEDEHFVKQLQQEHLEMLT